MHQVSTKEQQTIQMNNKNELTLRKRGSKIDSALGVATTGKLGFLCERGVRVLMWQ